MRGQLIALAMVAALPVWASEPPGGDLLEFLGSVDMAEEGWTDYLEQVDLDRIARNSRKPAPAPLPTAVPPPSTPAPPAPNQAGDKTAPPPAADPGNDGGKQS